MKFFEIKAKNFASCVSPEQEEALYEYRLEAPNHNSAELGVGGGGAFAYIVAAQAEIGSGKSFAISPFHKKYFHGELWKKQVEYADGYSTEEIGNPSLLALFTKFKAQHLSEFSDYIEIVPYASMDIPVPLRQKMWPLSFVFIDACHWSPSAYYDTLALAPLVEVDGIVLFHDWGWGLESQRKLDEDVKLAIEKINCDGEQFWELQEWYDTKCGLGLIRRVK